MGRQVYGFCLRFPALDKSRKSSPTLNTELFVWVLVTLPETLQLGQHGELKREVSRPLFLKKIKQVRFVLNTIRKLLIYDYGLKLKSEQETGLDIVPAGGTLLCLNPLNLPCLMTWPKQIHFSSSIYVTIHFTSTHLRTGTDKVGFYAQLSSVHKRIKAAGRTCFSSTATTQKNI